MPGERKALEELLDAITKGEATAARIARATPELPRARVLEDRLVEETQVRQSQPRLT
ncbi:hypothetical protein HY251_14355 [bacterium]|nr:hypothetical protein [bacterium]